MCEALKRLMKDEIEAEVNAAVNESTVNIAESMIKDGESAAKIQKYTQLTLEKLQELSEKLGVALVI